MKVVTFGELMLRLSPKNEERFVQTACFDVCAGGAEANVAVCLAALGHESYFVSRLPEHEIGQMAVNTLRQQGVRTDYIKRGGERVGLYFTETGSALRPSQVIYDRAHSAIAEATANDFDWNGIFQNATWFHFSGITPALSKSAAEITLLACQQARERGVTVSCDLNYRHKLWSPEQAQKTMRKLMPYVDVLIGNEEDQQLALGMKNAANEWNIRYVATSLRESFSASDNAWRGIINDGLQEWESHPYRIHPIVDRIGTGDAFAAGVIHGLMMQYSEQETVEFAVACSALKHTVKGDFHCVSEQEIRNLMDGESHGRIQR